MSRVRNDHQKLYLISARHSSPMKKSMQPRYPNTVAHQSVRVCCQRIVVVIQETRGACSQPKNWLITPVALKWCARVLLKPNDNNCHDHELRTWSRYKCTGRREREQVIRTLRTGRPSERFTLMLMVLYRFVYDDFLSLFFLWWHQWNPNDPKRTRSRRAYRKEPVRLKSVSHRVHDDGFALRVFISPEQHHWLLHSPALMITRGVSIAYVQLSTRRDACFIVISHLCRFPGRLISLTQASQHTHIFFRAFQITWHLAHMHQLALCMRGLRLGFTKVCEERHFWY